FASTTPNAPYTLSLHDALPIFSLGWALVFQGLVEHAPQGQHAGVRAHYEEALALFRDLGNVGGMAQMHFLLGILLCYCQGDALRDRKSTRLNSSHLVISYAVFC